LIKLLAIFGTRPEAVKLAPVLKALERHPDKIESRVCVTAQHRDMLDQVMRVFDIRPHYDLDVMRPDQTLAEVTAHILNRLDPVLAAERPDWVLVQGDTTTVMTAALAAFYRRIKVGHVEAGLRTGNLAQPFPEEANRRIAGVVANLHFAPTETARQNLLREGVPDAAIRVTGNPVIDALLMAADMPYDPANDPLRDVQCDRRILLVTAHRRENFGAPMEQICLALRDLAEAYRDDVHIVFPVHRNPNAREPAHRLLADLPNVTLTEPLDYLPLVHLLKRATLVLTDSGGIQEEAPSLGKPVLVLRKTTERSEGVAAGVARVVGTDRAEIVRQTRRLLDNQGDYDAMARATNPYGDGRASERIVEALLAAA
jgi:UDP-N-acetylglucosamine 2-epimerase (non-hydrolysing)